ncbi:MAG: pseudouridine synthase [Alphaproteobacteria bacterium]
MKSAPQTPRDDGKGERIAKRLARAGVCSRREAERWIEQGRVAVDGVVLTTPAFLVTEASEIVVDGKPVRRAPPTRLWRFNKPEGVMTTHSDPQGRQTLFQMLPAGFPRVVSVGRLDLNSEGLILLTNDGELARRLELPVNALPRRYRVRIYGFVRATDIAKLAEGITIEGVNYGAIDAALEKQTGSNAWLTMTLREGKNREIRRVCEAFGWRVNRLIRVAYGPFELVNLPIGAVDEIDASEIGRGLGKLAEGLRLRLPEPRREYRGDRPNRPGPKHHAHRRR